MLPKFEQFIKERQYLHNVSPGTVAWHTHNLKWLLSETPTEVELKAMVVRMPNVVPENLVSLTMPVRTESYP